MSKRFKVLTYGGTAVVGILLGAATNGGAPAEPTEQPTPRVITETTVVRPEACLEALRLADSNFDITSQAFDVTSEIFGAMGAGLDAIVAERFDVAEVQVERANALSADLRDLRELLMIEEYNVASAACRA